MGWSNGPEVEWRLARTIRDYEMAAVIAVKAVNIKDARSSKPIGHIRLKERAGTIRVGPMRVSISEWEPDVGFDARGIEVGSPLSVADLPYVARGDANNKKSYDLASRRLREKYGLFASRQWRPELTFVEVLWFDRDRGRHWFARPERARKMLGTDALDEGRLTEKSPYLGADPVQWYIIAGPEEDWPENDWPMPFTAGESPTKPTISTFRESIEPVAGDPSEPPPAHPQSRSPDRTFIGETTPVANFVESVDSVLYSVRVLLSTGRAGDKILYLMEPDELAEILTYDLTAMYTESGAQTEIAAASATKWVDRHIYNGDWDAALSTLIDECETIVHAAYSGDEAFDRLDWKQQLEQTIEKCRNRL